MLIHSIVIYPMNSAIHLLNNQGQENKVQTLTTKDCKGPQTNMPENVENKHSWLGVRVPIAATFAIIVVGERNWITSDLFQ